MARTPELALSDSRKAYGPWRILFFFTAAFFKSLRLIESIKLTATHFAAEEDWDLLAIYYDAIDHAGHVFMEYHPPAMAHVSEEDAAAFGSVIAGIYRFHDMLLGRLLDFVGPDTTVIILSDHGFCHDQLRPKVREHFRDPSKKFGAEMNPVAWHRLQGVFVAAGQALKRDE